MTDLDTFLVSPSHAKTESFLVADSAAKIDLIDS